MHHSLAAWHDQLSDSRAWFDLPHLHYQSLLSLADRLHREGAVDTADLIDLQELCLSARDWHIEELANDYLQRAGQYEIVDASGLRLGDADGYKLYLDGSAERYLAQRDASGLSVIEATLGTSVAKVVHDRVHWVDGRSLTLVRTATRIEGALVPFHG